MTHPPTHHRRQDRGAPEHRPQREPDRGGGVSNYAWDVFASATDRTDVDWSFEVTPHPEHANIVNMKISRGCWDTAFEIPTALWEDLKKKVKAMP